jgi:hypothetical protein
VESRGRDSSVKGSEGKSNGVREWCQFGENEWDNKSNPISFFLLKKKKRKKKKRKEER